MNVSLRRLANRGFTGISVASVLLLAAALLVVLGPMLLEGGTAVFFDGTVEFRKVQLHRFGRGEPAAVEREAAAAAQAREPIYRILDAFERGIDTDRLEDDARTVYRELGKQLKHREGVTPEDRLQIRRFVRGLRNTLVEAYECTEKAEARQLLAEVLAHEEDPRLKGTVAERLFRMARDYRDLLETFDLGKREQYAEALEEVQAAIGKLFGPRPGEPLPQLAMNRYGAHRMDLVERWSDDLYYAETWVQEEEGQPLVKKRIPREEQFAGTTLAALFPLFREKTDAMFRPRFTVYWQYFLDDSVPGHYFGGVGEEILGTLTVTVLAILFAFPLGVISAAYLVEVAGDNVVVRFIRMCINTLAGVPSIVFGLFGLAFFVMVIYEASDGAHKGPSVLACALTGSVLILPVIIRASEEAIRAVPHSYKEAALALGASRLRCFVTVQLPAALPGILTGVILSLSRAAGETAPYLFAGAAATTDALWESAVWDWPWQQTQMLSYGAYDLAMNDRIAAMVPHQQWGMVMSLILLTLTLNIVAIALRWRISRKLRGG
ncbi:MAG: phosphate ABC transporter permease PstA [Phycisphaerae bacterium]